MGESILIWALTILILTSACMQSGIPESYYNESCRERGYDFALPILVDDEVAGFNCCTEIDEHTAECLDYYPLQ